MLRHLLRPARLAPLPRRLLCAGAAPAAPGPVASVCSARVAALADDVVSLNMLEVRALRDALQDRLGLDDAALSGGMPAMSPAMLAAMGGGGGGGAEKEEEKVEQTSFDLKLEGFEPAKKIAVIKEIRAITSLGLKEAKALVDEAPKVFKTAVGKEEGEAIMEKLKAIGAKVKLE